MTSSTPPGKYLSQIGGLEFPHRGRGQSLNGDVYVSTFSPERRHVYAFLRQPLSPTFGESPPAFAVAIHRQGLRHPAFGTDRSLQLLGALSRPSTPIGPQRHRRPIDGDVYVDESEAAFRANRSPGSTPPATGLKPSPSGLTSGVAIDPEGNLYATNAGGTASRSSRPLSPPTRGSTTRWSSTRSLEPEARHTADFQLTPDGDVAAFPSTLPLAGGEEETAGHPEIYRYDAASEGSTASPAPPPANPLPTMPRLAANGLSLTDDGRVFFNTADPLVAADTDEQTGRLRVGAAGRRQLPAPQAPPSAAAGACLALISAGTGAFDSGLLGATPNGTDAYFFTRDSLAPQDKNGPTMKIYDAREAAASPILSPPSPARPPTSATAPPARLPGPLKVGSEPAPHRRLRTRCKKCTGLLPKHGQCVGKTKPHPTSTASEPTTKGGGQK